MSLALEDFTPSPHLLPNRSATWPRPYTTYAYPESSPASISSQPPQPYIPRMPESPVSSQDISDLPNPAWYGPPPPDHNAYRISSATREAVHVAPTHTSYAPFNQFVPHTSSIGLSQPTSAFLQAGEAHHDLSRAISPTSVYSRNSLNCDSTRVSEEPPFYSHPKTVAHFENQQHNRDHFGSRMNMSQSTPVSWAINALGINTPAMQPDLYQTPYPQGFQNPFLGSAVEKAPSSHLISPQPRRIFTPIAPQITDITNQLTAKRQRDEEEAVQESKRRRRSESNTSAQPELSDEDKLLLKLKDEDAIPWKDIAARFQAELGKTYQIPALQMRLKRLRERLRVWSDTDLKALRMAHEFWTQNKYDIISQKVSRRCVPMQRRHQLTATGAGLRRTGKVDRAPMRTQVV
jgi:hypothetical protein